MEDEVQRCIREARARALARAGISDPCAGAGQLPPPRAPSPNQFAGSQCGGAIRRPRPPSPAREPPVEELVYVSPPRPADPASIEYLSRVCELSEQPVPQPCSPQHQPQLPEWDYGNLKGPGYEDPALWQQVQHFDPCMPAGAEGPPPVNSASNYALLSEVCAPEVDVSGTVEEVLGRARHRARLGAGERKNVPLFPAPYKPGSATKDPCLPQVTQVPPPTCEMQEDYSAQFDCPTENEDFDDLQLLPPSALDLDDDFVAQCAQSQQITTDAYGLPFRRYPHAEKAKQENLERERVAAMRRQQEARMQAEAQQRAAQIAAQEAACRVTSAPPPPPRAGNACVRPTSGRTASTSRSGVRTASATQAGPSRTQPSTSRGAGGVCPPPGRKTPAQIAADERAAKVASAAAATKARTKYQPPKLKSRPPPKPPTVPKAPRGLDKKPDRRGPDPTRDCSFEMDYDNNFIQPEGMGLDCPEPRPINVGCPVNMEFEGSTIAPPNPGQGGGACGGGGGSNNSPTPKPPGEEDQWYTCQYFLYEDKGWVLNYCWDH